MRKQAVVVALGLALLLFGRPSEAGVINFGFDIHDDAGDGYNAGGPIYNVSEATMDSVSQYLSSQGYSDMSQLPPAVLLAVAVNAPLNHILIAALVGGVPLATVQGVQAILVNDGADLNKPLWGPTGYQVLTPSDPDFYNYYDQGTNHLASTGLQGPLFTGDDTGDWLQPEGVWCAGFFVAQGGCVPTAPADDFLEFSLDTDASFWAGKNIIGFDFFVDAEEYDSQFGEFLVELGHGLGWVPLGLLADNAGDDSSWHIDANNPLFGLVLQDIIAGTFAFRVSAQDFAIGRIDGVNLAVQYVPEPVALLLFGTGLTALAMRHRRRRA